MNGASRWDAWMLVSSLLLIAAVGLRYPLLGLLGAGMFTTAASVTLWERYALRQVTYRRVLAEHRAFFGEELPLTVEIENRKPLPLPWLRADDVIPAGLEVIGEDTYLDREAGRAVLHQLVSIRWFERVRLRYRLRCATRGVFTLGPVRLESGDPFGFAAREQTLPILDRILVYPKMVPIEQLGLPSRHPFGDASDRRRLFQDPTRVIGVREYTSDDSPRHIHWKASARLQQLQTRVFDATTSHTLMLYVNLASFDRYWWVSLNRDSLEMVILTAASVARWAVEQGYQVGIATNGAPAGGGEELTVPPAGDPQQLVRLLEALARISMFARTPLEQMLARDRTRLPWGTTVVVVSAVVPDGLLRVLLSFKAAGHAPTILYVADDTIGGAPSLPGVTSLNGVTVYTVPAEPGWQRAETLLVAGA